MGQNYKEEEIKNMSMPKQVSSPFKVWDFDIM